MRSGQTEETRRKIECIRAVFYHQNNYYLRITDKIIKEVKKKPKATKMSNDESGDKKHWLVLPYKGVKETSILRSIQDYVKKLLPKNSFLHA